MKWAIPYVSDEDSMGKRDKDWMRLRVIFSVLPIGQLMGGDVSSLSNNTLVFYYPTIISLNQGNPCSRPILENAE